MPEFPLVPASRFARMADELAERGWSVQEQLLPEPLAQALERDCRALWQQDDLTPAAIGRGDGQLVMPGIRGDYTRWLDDCPQTSASRTYLGLMDGVRETLNRSLDDQVLFKLFLDKWDGQTEVVPALPGNAGDIPPVIVGRRS